MVQGIRLVEFAIPYGNHQGFSGRTLAFGRFAAAAARLALAEPWDLVIASSTPLTVVVPALLARRLRGTPFVYEIRDPGRSCRAPWAPRRRWRWLRWSRWPVPPAARPPAWWR
ncbi:hypothetical protein ACFQU7_17235 [Pseudoroseomonas wenyumeiae]